MNSVAIDCPLLTSHLKPFYELLDRHLYSEIIMNRPNELWLECEGRWERMVSQILTLEHIDRLAISLEDYHQRKRMNSPLLSSSLPTGERIELVFSPLVKTRHLGLAIRSAGHQVYELGKMIDETVKTSIEKRNYRRSRLKDLYGQLSVKEFFKESVKSHANIVVSGGTSTGKTTFLNALIQIVPLEQRIVTIEDTSELAVPQPNHLSLYTAYSYGLKDLLRSSLRLRPDRLLIGELRGEEAFEFLRAINTGHPGAMTSIHAESAELAIEQLILMVMQGSKGLTPDYIRRYIHSLIDMVIQLERLPSGRRVVREILFLPDEQ